jgi:hypothetical protein
MPREQLPLTWGQDKINGPGLPNFARNIHTGKELQN